ncbi:unnamed protein product [Sphacelaria rigidula]
MSVTQAIFRNNSALWGGAIALFSCGELDSYTGIQPVRTSRCTFTNNSASNGGGFFSSSGYDEVLDSQFTSNYAAISGGAIEHTGVLSAINDTVFEANVAGEEGCAVMSIGPLFDMKHVTFTNNSLHCPAGTYGYDDVIEGVEACRFQHVCARCSSDGKCKNTGDGVVIDNPTAIPVCEVAPEGTNTSDNGVTLGTLKLLPGYYRTAGDSPDVVKCHRHAACMGGAESSVYCAVGYTGPYCAACEDGFVQGFRYSCHSCAGQERTAAGWVVAVISLLILLALLVKDLTKVVDCDGSDGRRWRCQRILSKISDEISSSLPVTAIKIVLVVWQILTQFAEISGVEYPAAYGEFLAALDLINLNIGTILSFSCVMEVDFFDTLIFATIGPILLLGMLVGTYAVARNRNHASHEAMVMVWDRHISLAIFLLFFVYSSVSHTVFLTFSCDGSLDDGVSYLRADYSVTCGSHRHTAFRVYAAVMILIYPVGIPAMFAWWLIRDDKDLKDESGRTMPHLQPSRNLWEPYKPSAYWYELVEYIRRICLTGLSVFIYPGSAAQVAVTLLLAFVFTIVSETLAPFKERIDMWLYRSGTCVIFASMYLALLLKVDVSDENSDSQEAFSAVLILANVLLLATVMFEGALAIFGNWRAQKEQEIALVEGPTRRQRSTDSCGVLDLDESVTGASGRDGSNLTIPAVNPGNVYRFV